MERILEAFEDAWRRGECPDLADYLPAVGPDRFRLLVELAHEDLDYRLKAGGAARVEDYLRRYPELAGDADAVVSLIAAEWQLRVPQTKGMREEFLQRFAPYRDKLLTRLTVPGGAERTNEKGHRPRGVEVRAVTVRDLPPPKSATPRARRRLKARARGRLVRSARWARRRPILAGMLGLLGLGLAIGYAVTYAAYRTADARRIEAERSYHDNRLALKDEQTALAKAREATEKAEAAREEEGRKRRRAERERERSQIALYAEQLDNARQLWRGGEVERAVTVLDRCRPDLRHWEWGYLRQLCRRERADSFMLDHYFAAAREGEGAVSWSVVTGTFSPDGKSLISVAWDPERTGSELRLWDLATRRTVRTYRCPGLLCSSPCLSANGQVLATRGLPTSGGPPVVRLWATDSGEELATLCLAGHDIAALEFGPDGSWLVTRGKEGATRVWEVATGKERCHCEGRAAADADVAVSPDGKQIVSVGGLVQVLDPVACKEIKEQKVGNFQVVSAAFSADGKWLALSGIDQGREVVRLWHPPSGRELLVLQDCGGKVFFSPDGRYLVALGSQFARLWDSRTGRTRTVAGMGRRAIHPDGRRAFLQRYGSFEVRSLEAPPEYQTVGDAAVSLVSGVIPLATAYGPPVLSGDGRRLAATYGDGRVRVWDMASAREIQAVPAPLSLSLAISPNGTRLVTAGREAGTLIVWDADTGAELSTLTSKGTVTRLTFSQTGSLLAVSTAPNRDEHRVGDRPDAQEAPAPQGGRAELSVWETATGKKRFTLSGASAAGFLCVVILPDEKEILDFRPGRKPPVRGWDLLTGREVATNVSFSTAFPPVFSPDGRRIACFCPTGSDPRAEVCVADAASGTILWSVRPDADDISGLAFSPDGKRLAASCAKGGHVRVWETETGQEVFTLAAHAYYVDAVRFTSEGQGLLTLGLEAPTTRSYSVKRWDGPIRR
jgi:WD40 repeat protein